MGVFIGNLIAFAVILFVLWKFVVPPVKRLMKERQDTVRAQLEESRIAQEKLAQAGQAGERARSDAAREGSQIRDEARGDADAIREDLAWLGILPDLFRENQAVIATGSMRGDTFVAEEVLAKHDENYMPKEVADKMGVSHRKHNVQETPAP